MTNHRDGGNTLPSDKALTFFIWPTLKNSEPVNIVDQGLCRHKTRKCFHLSVPSNVTMLQAYNCDRQKPGQKANQMPAEKQIYKADYVTQHFVHYSTVTRTTNMPFDEYFKLYGQKRPFPDPLSRFGDEVEEALMIHRSVPILLLLYFAFLVFLLFFCCIFLSFFIFVLFFIYILFEYL